MAPDSPRPAPGPATGYSGTPLPRKLGIKAGLVDNKVCAIDQVWSGLRLVIRRELR